MAVRMLAWAWVVVGVLLYLRQFLALAEAIRGSLLH